MAHVKKTGTSNGEYRINHKKREVAVKAQNFESRLKVRTTFILGFMAVILLLLMSSCGEDEEEKPECERLEYATLTLINASSYEAFTVNLDGADIGDLYPGESLTRTVSAGQHTIETERLDTGVPACNPLTPNLGICVHEVFSCDAD